MNEPYIALLTEEHIHFAALVYACLQADALQAIRLDDPRTFADTYQNYLQGLTRLCDVLDVHPLVVDPNRWLFPCANFWSFLESALNDIPSTSLARNTGDSTALLPVPEAFLLHHLHQPDSSLPLNQKTRLLHLQSRFRGSDVPLQVCFSAKWNRLPRSDQELVSPCPLFIRGLRFSSSFDDLSARIRQLLQMRFGSSSITTSYWMEHLQNALTQYQQAAGRFQQALDLGEMLVELEQMEQLQYDWNCVLQLLNGQTLSKEVRNRMSESLRIPCDSFDNYL